MADSPLKLSRDERQMDHVTQMKYSRRLQQAIDEGAGAVVLRNALAQARAAGCENSRIHRAIIRKGETVLPRMEALEIAKSNGMAPKDIAKGLRGWLEQRKSRNASEFPVLLGSRSSSSAREPSLDYKEARWKLRR